MSKQKLIEKLESEKLKSSFMEDHHFNNGIEWAIKVIKSHDFAEPDEKLRKVREELDNIKPTYIEFYNQGIERALRLIDSHLVPQPSEEVRAIEAEIKRVSGLDYATPEAKTCVLWVLEQRLKEAKGER